MSYFFRVRTDFALYHVHYEYASTLQPGPCQSVAPAQGPMYLALVSLSDWNGSCAPVYALILGRPLRIINITHSCDRVEIFSVGDH